MKDGKYYSKKMGQHVWLKKHTHESPYDCCDKCGKPIKTVYSVNAEDGYEYLFGAECIRKMGLVKEENTQ